MNKLTFTKKPCCTATIYYYDQIDARDVEAAFVNLDYLYLRNGVDYRNKSDEALIKEFCNDEDYHLYRVVRKEEWMDWPDQVPHQGQLH